MVGMVWRLHRTCRLSSEFISHNTVDSSRNVKHLVTIESHVALLFKTISLLWPTNRFIGKTISSSIGYVNNRVVEYILTLLQLYYKYYQFCCTTNFAEKSLETTCWIHKHKNNKVLLFPLLMLWARSGMCLWIKWKIVAK